MSRGLVQSVGGLNRTQRWRKGEFLCSPVFELGCWPSPALGLRLRLEDAPSLHNQVSHVLGLGSLFVCVSTDSLWGTQTSTSSEEDHGETPTLWYVEEGAQYHDL